ncbi:MAG: hypothetical protein ACLPQS_14475 [Acidimicrobiales bacterium]
MAWWPEDSRATNERHAAADARNAAVARHRKIKAWLWFVCGSSGLAGLAVDVASSSTLSVEHQIIGPALLFAMLASGLAIVLLSLKWSSSSRVSADYIAHAPRPQSNRTLYRRPSSTSSLKGYQPLLTRRPSREDRKLDALANERTGQRRPED